MSVASILRYVFIRRVYTISWKLNSLACKLVVNEHISNLWFCDPVFACPCSLAMQEVKLRIIVVVRWYEIETYMHARIYSSSPENNYHCFLLVSFRTLRDTVTRCLSARKEQLSNFQPLKFEFFMWRVTLFTKAIIFLF